MGKRTKEKWDDYYILCKGLFGLLDNLWDTYQRESLIRVAASALRNPIVFDNKIVGAYYKLPYRVDIDLDGKTVDDHLIGISNIVLYIHKKRLYERWLSSEDFKKTLKSLQVLLNIPQKLNTSKNFKSWQFDIKNIDKCIYWNEKLKQNNISNLISNEGVKVNVDDVWQNWYNEYKIDIT